MQIAAIQHSIVWENPPANIVQLNPKIAAAVASGAEFICLPEMFTTGFSLAATKIAEDLQGPSATFLCAQAAMHRIWICGSIPTNDPNFPRPTNQLVVAGPDGVLGRYNKIHPFSHSGEDKHYSAGHEMLTLKIGGLRTTFFVCYDLRFADKFYGAAANTDLYVVPANWPRSRRNHWKVLLQARAIENQAYVVGVNRVGTDANGVSYAGDSMTIDPMGRVLNASVAVEAEVKASAEATIMATVDPTEVTKVRNRYRFLTDRR